MKRKVALLLVMLMLLALASGCNTEGTDTSNVGGVSTGAGSENDASLGLTESEMALLEGCGISLEEFYAMEPEEQQALLDELGIVANDKVEEETRATQKTYTVEDVAGSGSFVVRIGDGRWNNYYLYYEGGQLVKVEISFQKNDEEEAEEYIFEGDTLTEFWYYDKTLQELIDYFDSNGYGYSTSIYCLD